MVDKIDFDVAVVGGGLAGAAAALALVQQGCSVRLYERRDLARDPNRGDILHAPTVEIVRRLGILGLLEERGAGRWHGLRIVDSQGRFSAESEIRESWLLNHAEMEAAFLDAAEEQGADVKNEVVRSLAPEGDETDPRWVLATDDGTDRVRFVVGADGAESLTRRTLGIELADYHEYDNCIVVLHSPSPSWLPPDFGWTFLHPEGNIFLLPTTPSPRHRVIVSIAKEDIKDWMTASEQDLSARLAERHSGLGELQINKRGGSHVYRIKRSHASNYSGASAALTGDAAHTIHPMGGQGLNLAIQDSVKLAELVGPALVGPAGDPGAVRQALVEYEEVRRPINTTTIDLAHMHSMLAGPGEDHYERALAYYGQSQTNPDFVRAFHSQFGGRES